MDLKKVFYNTVVSLEEMIDTVDPNGSDITRMSLYCQLM